MKICGLGLLYGVFTLLLVFTTLDSYSQDIFSKPDSLEILVFKKTKGFSAAINNEDSFYIKRQFYQGLFLIDQYYYFRKSEAYKIDTLLRLDDRWLIVKNKYWQTYFSRDEFEKRNSWLIRDGDYCYQNIPLEMAKERKKIYIFNLTYCEDLGNHLNAKIYFELGKGIVKITYHTGVTFELSSSGVSDDKK